MTGRGARVRVIPKEFCRACREKTTVDAHGYCRFCAWRHNEGMVVEEMLRRQKEREESDGE